MGRENRGNGGFALLCCFIAFGISAVLAFITYLLPYVADVAVGDTAMNVMEIILNVSTLVGVACGAFAFSQRRGMLVKVFTVIFVLVFVAAIVLHIFAP